MKMNNLQAPKKQTQFKPNFFKGRAGLLTDLKILVTVQNQNCA